MKHFLFMVALGVAAGGTSYAAPPTLRLSAAVAEAREANPALKAAREKLGVLEGGVLEAGALSNPELEFSIGEIEAGTAETEDATKEYGISQEWQMGGKRGLRRAAAQSELAAARAEVLALANAVARQVKEAYWALSLAQDRLHFARENLQFQQRFLSRVQDRFQSGRASVADLSRAKLEVARAESVLLRADNTLKKAGSRLNLALGRPIGDTPPDIEHLEEQIFKPERARLAQSALENRPEITALTSLKEGAAARLRLARRLPLIPDLRTGLFYQENEREDGRDSWGASLGVSVPLFYRYRGERLATKAELRSIDARMEEARQTIAFDVEESVLDVEEAQAQIEVFKRSVDEATEAARVAEQRYAEGEADLLVFLQARRDLVAVTLEYLETLKDYQVNLARLEEAVGANILGGYTQ